jgi:hypothetical protein
MEELTAIARKPPRDLTEVKHSMCIQHVPYRHKTYERGSLLSRLDIGKAVRLVYCRGHFA